ncbi:MAG: energy transducer TonB [Candidatus Zixiibacteriota bacterium]
MVRFLISAVAVFFTVAGCYSKNPEVSLECVDPYPMPNENAIVRHNVDPQVISRVEPEYPRIAHQAGLTGTTVMNVLVDRCGKVRTARVATSSGTQALDDAAVAVMYKWRFSPASDAGIPIAAWTSETIEFKLP